MEALEAYRKHLGPVMRFCANALVAFACVTMNIELSAIVTPAQKRVLGDRRRRTLSSLEAVAEVGASSSEAPAAIPMAVAVEVEEVFEESKHSEDVPGDVEAAAAPPVAAPSRSVSLGAEGCERLVAARQRSLERGGGRAARVDVRGVRQPGQVGGSPVMKSQYSARVGAGAA